MADHMNNAALAKLEPYLLMSKSAKGAAATKLIQDATSAPGVFVFSELLEMPSIQDVGPEFADIVRLMMNREIVSTPVATRTMAFFVEALRVWDLQ